MKPCKCVEMKHQLGGPEMGIWERDDLKCSYCGDEVNHCSFRDLPSRKEYRLSGLCQECQDLVFERSEHESERTEI